MGSDFAFTATASYQNFETASSLWEPAKENHPDKVRGNMFWCFARAPCPIVYLSIRNLLC
jgi:hypothetical protein